MFIPYNTDAPLYHYPITTIGLIAVNTVVLIACGQATDADQVVPWILQFGDGLHPLQWISGNFMHAGIMHLLGNMFFLWGFGLVVEGKLGWWRFLLLYLAIGIIYSFVIQMAMLGSHGGALGASGVLFGLMAIALIWAPKNEMDCFIWFVTGRLVEVPITVFATVYLLWQFAIAMLTHFSMSSAMLHLTGAGVGAIFGVAMLKFGMVDCEGWDLFAVRAGREGQRRDESPALILKRAEPPPRELLSAEQAKFFVTVVKNRIASGDIAGAADFYQQRRALNPDWRLEEPDLMALIRSLNEHRLWPAAIRPMTDYVQQFPATAARIQLKLAQILIDISRRPAKALKILDGMDPQTLAPALRSLHERLRSAAEQLQTECDLEIADGDDS